MTCRRTAVVVALPLLGLAGCSGHTGGYDIAAICKTATYPVASVNDLYAIRDAIIAAAPKKLGDPPAGKPFKKFRLGIKLGTEANTAAAPYAVPERMRPTDLPKRPDTTKVVAAQKDLAAACR